MLSRANQGFAPNDVIGIGIDGSRACDAFGSGKPTGFRGTMYIDSAKEGAQAIQLLYASVKNDTALPVTTYVSADLITADTFGSYRTSYVTSRLDGAAKRRVPPRSRRSKRARRRRRNARGARSCRLGVSKRFGVVRALDDVTVRAGEVLALVGENGAGKSTLVRIFDGVYRPDQGTLAAAGVQQTLRSSADAHALGIRVIHQEPDIIPDLSIAENLFLGDFRRIHGLLLDRADLSRRTRSLLAEFGLESDLDPWTRAGDLSPAQRQLMEIMRALRRGLKVLALDEPASSLTEDEAQRLFGVVRRLRDDGVGVIYISHRMPEVQDLADRIAVLRDGRLVDERPTQKFPEAEIVQAMVGRPIADLYERGARRRGEIACSVQGLTTVRVNDASFDVHSGEVVGLAGLIGAGRSELAEAIFGHDRALTGSVVVEGWPVRLRSPADAIAAGIDFAPEDRKSQALLLRSVKDNISLAIPDLISRFAFINDGDERRIAGALVDRLRIRTSSLDASAANLSGVNQQKVVLGCWLARRTKVLILDEATRGVDVGAKAEIYRLIAELAAEGIALLVISSEMPELLGLADRILVMAGGRVVAELPRQEASEERILNLAMADNLTHAATAP